MRVLLLVLVLQLYAVPQQPKYVWPWHMRSYADGAPQWLTNREFQRQLWMI